MLYYHPSIDELYPGFFCQKMVEDYSTHVNYPSEYAELLMLGDMFEWENHVLTQKEYDDIVAYTGDMRNGPGRPIVGFIRAIK